MLKKALASFIFKYLNDFTLSANCRPNITCTEIKEREIECRSLKLFLITKSLQYFISANPKVRLQVLRTPFRHVGYRLCNITARSQLWKLH